MKILLNKQDYEVTDDVSYEGYVYIHKKNKHLILEEVDELANVYTFYLLKGNQRFNLGDAQDTLNPYYADDDSDIELEPKDLFK